MSSRLAGEIVEVWSTGLSGISRERRIGNPLNRDPQRWVSPPRYWTEGQLIGFELIALLSSLHSLYVCPPLPSESTVAET